VSEVGFGAWGIAGTLWLGSTEEESRRALAAAHDSGITFFDTALAYGDGLSERLIGETLRAPLAGGSAIVASKIPPKNRLWPARHDVPLADVFPADYVRACTEASLGFLGLPALPLQQFHVWQDRWLDDPGWDRTREAMLRLKEEGKVLHWGISINDHDPASAMRALRDPLFETAQMIYNIYDRSPEPALFPFAAERGLGIINRVPFDEGGLTGAIEPKTRFAAGDFRARYFRGERPAEAARRAGALKPLLGSEAATLPELALRFCLSRPEVSVVIPGARTPGHAQANAAVSDGRRLSPALLGRLAEHAWEKNWYAT